MQKVMVLLDWSPNTNHTGLYVAQDQGYYQDEGLDVTLLQPDESSNTKLVATGKADFAISAQESVTQARAEDIPVVSIATIIQHNTSAFASLKSANILSVKDLEHKRYGGWGTPVEEAVLTAVMNDAGADFKKVTNVSIGDMDFLSTIGRTADFEWIFYGWEGINAEINNIALNYIFLSDLKPVLDYYTPVIITNEDHINNQSELVKKFMRATSKGYEFAIGHPDEAGEILLKAVPELNRDLVIKSQAWLSPRYKAEATKWGIQKSSVWKGYAEWLNEHKLITKLTDPNESFTNNFLP
jgi:ABC-type nitrate/sulfonate/bicarbonate transport system substrate-binding protein